MEAKEVGFDQMSLSGKLERLLGMTDDLIDDTNKRFAILSHYIAALGDAAGIKVDLTLDAEMTPYEALTATLQQKAATIQGRLEELQTTLNSQYDVMLRMLHGTTQRLIDFEEFEAIQKATENSSEGTIARVTEAQRRKIANLDKQLKKL